MAEPELKILILNQSFWPDVVATAQHAHDLARDFAQRGAQVTVVASRSMYGQSGSSLPAFERIDGISVHRVSRNRFGKTGALARSIDYLMFNIACLLRALSLPRHDVVICLTTPPFIAIVGVVLRRAKGSKLIIWAMDLYPDLPAAAGMLSRRGLLFRILDRVDKWALDHADRVVALGRCMHARILQKGVRRERLSTIPPWSDPREVAFRLPDGLSTEALPTLSASPPMPVAEVNYRDRWGIGNRFVIQYSGNLGMGHDVDTVCQAMLTTKEDDGIRWVFVGDGVRRPELRRFIDKHEIRNVIVQPYEPRAHLGSLLALADVHLVTMSPSFEGIILPSKFFGALAAGRPTIFIGPQWTEVALIIADHRCGFVVDNGDHVGLVDVIQRLRLDVGEALAMGVRARRALESSFTMERSCQNWWDTVLAVLRPSSEHALGALAPSILAAAMDSPASLRILVLSQYFPPDITAAAYRIGDTYRLLSARGHQVKVITSTPHKGGIDAASSRDVVVDDVIRVKVKPLESRSSIAYLGQFFGFALRSFVAALRLRRTFRYDVVWASSPPLPVAIPSILLRAILRVPVVLDIRDIWPESAVNIGKLRRGSIMERCGSLLERLAYRFCDGLTCVSKPMKRYLSKRTSRPVEVVYNGAPQSQIDESGVAPDPRVFCYAGNLGYAQGLDGVIRAFSMFCASAPGRGEYRLNLIGTGAVEAELRALAEELGIVSQVHFLGVKPKCEAIRLMSAAGATLIPLVDSAAFGMTVPSKVFDCMALGRPIIASIRGEGREILESTGANVVVDPGDVPALAAAFETVSRDWDRLMAMAPDNITMVRERFSREAAIDRLEVVLRAVTDVESERS